MAAKTAIFFVYYRAENKVYIEKASALPVQQFRSVPQ